MATPPIISDFSGVRVTIFGPSLVRVIMGGGDSPSEPSGEEAIIRDCSTKITGDPKERIGEITDVLIKS